MALFPRAKITIATRKSPLALWQARYIQTQLQTLVPDTEIVMLPLSTEGDERLDRALAKIGGKGLFIKALETAMLAGEADIAVHSMKDMPAQLPAAFVIGAICARHEVRDALVAPRYSDWSSLPPGAVIGTSSLRRQVQLKYLRPDLKFKDLRGNLQTRLKKLEAGDFDAIVLAATGLQRLGLSSYITSTFSTQAMLPACGQGALGIECRADDTVMQQLLSHLNESTAVASVTAERSMNALLNGSCQVPIAAYAAVSGDTLDLEGRIGSLDGTQMLFAKASGPVAEASNIGIEVANQLIAQGGQTLIEAILKG